MKVVEHVLYFIILLNFEEIFSDSVTKNFIEKEGNF